MLTHKQHGVHAPSHVLCALDQVVAQQNFEVDPVVRPKEPKLKLW